MQQQAYPYFSAAAEALRDAGYRFDAQACIWRNDAGSVARIERRRRAETGLRRREYWVLVDQSTSAAVC